MADKYELKLIVGFITGWMSGRLFVPPALKGRDILTDKTAIQWQVRFVSYFIKNLRDHKAIVAWNLGNECNNGFDIDFQFEDQPLKDSMLYMVRSRETDKLTL